MNHACDENPSRRRWRQAGRWLALAAALCLAWPLQTGSWTSVILPALSPHIAAGATLAARSAGIIGLLALPVSILILVFPRWFCRHACPVGLLQEQIEKLRRSPAPPWRRAPLLGRWMLLATLGGACLGYPFFLWLDPLALFNGFVNAWRAPLTGAALLAGIGLPLLLLLDLLLPRLWCQRVCPLGALQELLALFRRRLRPASRCETASEAETASAKGWTLARRGFLAAGAGAAGALGLGLGRERDPLPLRPPGSLGEDRFAGVCVRCGNCAQACPSRIVRPMLRGDLAGLLTPTLSFERDYCREDCHQCGRVCPSGAIARSSLQEKLRQVIGPARVDLDVCLLANGRECTACIQRCPFRAIALKTTQDGFATEPAVDLARCVGCGACEAVCPTRPARAIRVTARPGRLPVQPIPSASVPEREPTPNTPSIKS